MRITKIAINNFRLLNNSVMDFDRDLCLLLGRNNTGNVAVNEILSGTGNAFPVSTIHSFLNRVINSRKLIYVACSRAMSGLVCVKVLTAEEIDAFKDTFSCAEQI